MADGKALSPADWARAALEAIAVGGVDAISIEQLARELGVSKGSFYWHFNDRAALVAAALRLWEQQSTKDIIGAVGSIEDSGQRLVRLAEIALGGQLNGAVDVALLARADDPLVGPVIRRVNLTRIRFLEDAFNQLGLSPASAARQARIAYSAYIGHFVVRRSVPNDKHLHRPSAAYLDQFLRTVAPFRE